MTSIDALGLPCPIPVVKAKKAILALPAEGGGVRVLVDNRVACENLTKMAEGCGYGYSSETLPDGTFAFTITVGAGQVQAVAPVAPMAAGGSAGGGLVVAIGSDAMGRGSEELGRILIKGFLFSLTQLPAPPEALLFFNSGVKLATDSANTLEDLRTLAANGTAIWVCGTCVDYYGCKEQIAVGEITNMYGIMEAMNAAGRLLSL